MTHEPDWKQDQAETSRLKPATTEQIDRCPHSIRRSMCLVCSQPAMTQAQTMLELADRVGKDLACTRTHTLQEWDLIEKALRATAAAAQPVAREAREAAAKIAETMFHCDCGKFIAAKIRATPSPLPAPGEEYDPAIVEEIKSADASVPEAKFDNVDDMLNWLNAPGEVAGGGEAVAWPVGKDRIDLVRSIAKDLFASGDVTQFDTLAEMYTSRILQSLENRFATLSPGGGAVEAIEDVISTFEQMRGYPEGDSNDPCFDLCGMPCCDEFGCLHQKTRTARAALSALPPAQADGEIDPNEIWEQYLAQLEGEPSPQGAMAFALSHTRPQSNTAAD